MDILFFIEGVFVERCRVGVVSVSFLLVAFIVGVVDGLFRLRRLFIVYWSDREGLGLGSGGFFRYVGLGVEVGGYRGCELERGGLRLCRVRGFGGEVMFVFVVFRVWLYLFYSFFF